MSWRERKKTQKTQKERKTQKTQREKKNSNTHGKTQTRERISVVYFSFVESSILLYSFIECSIEHSRYFFLWIRTVVLLFFYCVLFCLALSAELKDLANRKRVAFREIDYSILEQTCSIILYSLSILYLPCTK